MNSVGADHVRYLQRVSFATAPRKKSTWKEHLGWNRCPVQIAEAEGVVAAGDPLLRHLDDAWIVDRQGT